MGRVLYWPPVGIGQSAAEHPTIHGAAPAAKNYWPKMSRVPKLRNSSTEEELVKCKKLILGFYLKANEIPKLKTIKGGWDKIMNKAYLQLLMQLYQ